MDTKLITKQWMDLNKTVFDHAFQTMTMLQDQTENMAFRLLGKAQWLSDDGKKVISEWTKSCKKNREYIKTYADDNYKKITDYLIKTENE